MRTEKENKVAFSSSVGRDGLDKGNISETVKSGLPWRWVVNEVRLLIG